MEIIIDSYIKVMLLLFISIALLCSYKIIIWVYRQLFIKTPDSAILKHFTDRESVGCFSCIHYKHTFLDKLRPCCMKKDVTLIRQDEKKESLLELYEYSGINSIRVLEMPKACDYYQEEL